ncbi:MAG: hypothetical protein QW594_01435 [Candidatus Woesearchaeota archaeon]
MKASKLLLAVLFAVVCLYATMNLAYALPVSIVSVEFDGNKLEPGTNNIQAIDKHQTVDVRVRFKVDPNVSKTLKNVQVEAVIRGYDQEDLIQDITDAFDAMPGRTYTKDLSLRLPVRMEPGTYKLRIRIENADGDGVIANYQLEVAGESHAIWVRDIMLNPPTVEAGRAMLATVRIQNVGNKNQKNGIKIELSIPQLNLGPVVDYIDELNREETTTSEELFLRIPECTPAGDYDVKVKVTYKNGDKETVASKKLTVTKSPTCGQTGSGGSGSGTTPAQPEIALSSALMSQKVLAGGKGSIYPITIANNGGSAKTFTITPVVGDWGAALVSPSNVLIVEPGQAKTVYVYVTAKPTALVGPSMFAVSIGADGKIIQEMTLLADIYTDGTVVQKPSQTTDLATVLQYVLIAILVLLVIFGVLIAFKKFTASDEHSSKKKKDEEDEDEEQYY